MIDPLHIARKVLNVIENVHELRRPRFVPSEVALVDLIEHVFWASVDQYEGTPLKARIFFAPTISLREGFPKEYGAEIIHLSSPPPLSRHTIRSLSPAHAKDGALLVEADLEAGLHIHAVLSSSSSTRGVSPDWLSVESRGPGCFTVCIGPTPILEFTRGTLKHLAGMSLDRGAAEELLMSANLFPHEPAGLNWHIASMLLDVGRAIDHHGTGGACWILPSGTFMGGELSDLGNKVELDPMFWEPFREMWEMRTSTITLLNSSGGPGHEWLLKHQWLQAATQEWDFLRQDAVTRTLSSLTKVDGAIVVNGTPQLLAFGVICNRFVCEPREVLQPNDPSDLTKGEQVDVSVFGGSRHRSAINFCASHSPAGAVVASHDGGVTVFASKERGVVVGSRVSPIASDAEVKSE
jgi:Probable sensor domain DACNV